MRKIEIKKVTQDDADFLYMLMNDKTILNRLNEAPTSKEDWIKAVLSWENDADEDGYIVWMDDKQIGWFAFNGLQSTNKIAYLKMAVILPKYQNKGIGTYVLSKLLEMMRRNRYYSVRLFTNQDNWNAQKCYQKCGFKITESLAEKMSDNTVVARYKMECKL
ncbi:MAG: GNAT family N-acetyltransferase [bacterium]|nr:GNAT family N-acetyltransferase [bacterium]